MARPPKEGLDYFSFDVDIFENEKLFDLQNEYGPLGEVIYFRLLCLVYKNGYYYEFESIDKLSRILIKSIGNRWVRDKKVVSEVIPFLAECNLFSPELMRKNVLTSRGIQKRFLKATGRRQRDISKYWLLEKNNDSNGLITEPENQIDVYNNSINVCNNSKNISNNSTKQKESKLNINESKAAMDARDEFCRAIESEFGKLTGKLASSTDVRLICQLYDNCTDTVLIINAMQIAAKTYKPKYNGDRIYSFKYFIPAIRDAIEKKNGDGDNGTDRNTDSSPGGVPNRFGIQEEYI